MAEVTSCSRVDLFNELRLLDDYREIIIYYAVRHRFAGVDPTTTMQSAPFAIMSSGKRIITQKFHFIIVKATRIAVLLVTRILTKD